MSPSPLVFFTDRNLGVVFPRVLRGAGLVVEEHADHFVHDVPNPVWIAAVAARGWYAVTHDRHIGRRQGEIAAVLESGLGAFVLIGHARTSELAANFVRTRAAIEGFARRRARPFIARIYRPPPHEAARHPEAPGRVELWKP